MVGKHSVWALFGRVFLLGTILSNHRVHNNRQPWRASSPTGWRFWDQKFLKNWWQVLIHVPLKCIPIKYCPPKMENNIPQRDSGFPIKWGFLCTPINSHGIHELLRPELGQSFGPPDRYVNVLKALEISPSRCDELLQHPQDSLSYLPAIWHKGYLEDHPI